MLLARTPKCGNYSRRIRSPFIKVTRCSEVWTFIMLSAVEGWCVAVPLHHSRCLPLVSCSTADAVIECPIEKKTFPCNSPFCCCPLHRLHHCSPSAASPTRPVLPKRVHYLFHLNKINNTEHASHSNQFQLRQHNQTKRCTHFQRGLGCIPPLSFSCCNAVGGHFVLSLMPLCQPVSTCWCVNAAMRHSH